MFSNATTPISLKYTFPSIPNFQFPESTKDDDAQEHIYFMNVCLELFFDIFPIQQHMNEDVLKNMYKGFVQNEQNLFVFFDATTIKNVQVDENMYSWGIMDEILYTKKINNAEMDETIFSLFDENVFLTTLCDFKDKPFDIPFLLYMCEKKEEMFHTTQKTSPDIITLMYETTSHEWFGNGYFFSSVPLDESYDNVKKFAVFIKNAKYIIKKDTTQATEEEKTQFNIDMEEQDTHTIFFKENDLQFWCVKSTEHFVEII